MKKLAIWLAVTLAGLALLVGATGMLLPQEHVASIEINLDQAPDRVFATIADVARSPEWRPDLQRVEILSPAGEPLRWRETTDLGTITMAVEELQPPNRFVARIDDPDQPFGGRWIYTLAPSGSGTRLTITERGEVYNPLFRFMARFVFGHYRTLESYARNLAQHLGSAAEPVRKHDS